MKRVVRHDGVVLIMEHEAPSGVLAAFMFYLRLKAMGSADAPEFLEIKRGHLDQVPNHAQLSLALRNLRRSRQSSGKVRVILASESPSGSSPLMVV